MFVSLSTSDLVLFSTKTSPDSQSWILDSGATDHCTTELSDFHTYSPIDSPYQINGICCTAIGKGSIETEILTTKGRTIPITITDVLYVPSLKDRSKLTSCRLLSLSRLQQNSNASVQFTNTQACIHLPSGNNIPIYRPEDTFLYYVDTVIKSSQPPEHTSLSFTAQSTADNARLTHQRFGHQGTKCIINSQKETGQTPIHPDTIPFCNTCSQHKATTSHIKKATPPQAYHTFLPCWDGHLDSFHSIPAQLQVCSWIY